MGRQLWLVVLVLDFLMAAVCSAGSISGFVYEDANRDGLQGPQEAGVGGVPLTLLGAEGEVDLTIATTADGSFLFADLADGDYLLSLPEFAPIRASLPSTFAVPAPIPNFPFGSRRYSSPAHLLGNIEAADKLGQSPSHVGLGDSIGFGFNLCGSILGENGYFEPTTARLRNAAPRGFRGDKQSYPGDESADLLDPDIDLLVFANDVFYAVDEQADLVSISIGGNDFLGAESGGDAELAEALVIARRNIQELLASLVGELPQADVEINTVYDNLEGDDPLHNTWVPIWNQVLRETAWGQAGRVTVAEVYPEYAHDQMGDRRGEPGLICIAFGLDTIHPTNRGYDVHEEKLWQSFGGITVSSGEDVDDVFLGVTRRRGTALPVTTEIVGGEVSEPDLALVSDGQGALVSSADAELRVSDFLQFTPPAELELVRAVIDVTYRTTGAPLDDYYVFEASVDGTFAAPGKTPESWNTIIPVVGSSGNDGAERLAFPDQPAFRKASATLTLGAPTHNGDATLSLEDLDTLAVRLVTTAVGEPDAFAVEWDSTSVEVFVRPKDAQGMATKAAGKSLSVAGERARSLLETSRRLEPFESRETLILALGDPEASVRLAAARELRGLGLENSGVWMALLEDDSPRVREVAYLARATARQVQAAEVELATAEKDGRTRVAAGRSLLARSHVTGTRLLLGAAGGWPEDRAAAKALAQGQPDGGVLGQALSSDLPGQRVAAATALVAHPELAQASRQALVDMVAAKNELESWTARRALAGIGDQRALEAIDRLEYRPRLEVLLAFSGSASAEALFNLARNVDAPDTVRTRAARALALTASPATRSYLTVLSLSEQVRVSRLARSGLARLE